MLPKLSLELVPEGDGDTGQAYFECKTVVLKKINKIN